MKLKLAVPLLAIAALAGCAVYPAPGYEAYGPTYGVVQVAPVEPSAYFYGGYRNAPVYPR